VSPKRVGDIVTDAGTDVEAQVLATLNWEFPDMGLLGEESKGASPDSGWVWVVDPLDGTRNYSAGIPFFSMVTGYALQCPALCRSRLPCWGSADRRSPSRQPR
jgi:fructose-1,6-bisphosphatase/inositol monophosphatase family enzyme